MEVLLLICLFILISILLFLIYILELTPENKFQTNQDFRNKKRKKYKKPQYGRAKWSKKEEEILCMCVDFNIPPIKIKTILKNVLNVNRTRHSISDKIYKIKNNI